MKPAIEIQHLSKRYHRGTASLPYVSLRDVLAGALKRKGKNTEPFWALKDIHFSVGQGERIGIIGRNGAGKSTLLKIISQITPPTQGRVVLEGRVASLLEVGTGFHPELTGMENIFLNGSILGLTRAEVRRRLDEIIAFSGVEKFIHSPLKHYSSGMQMRLAFSVAAHLDADILLVDEVLSVGDVEFQKKCMQKMEEVSGRQDRTVVFVSHDLDAISRLTQSTLLLHEGLMLDFGPTPEIVNQYLNNLLEPVPIFTADKSLPHFTAFRLSPSLGGQSHAFAEAMSVEADLTLPEPVDVLEFSFQICNAANSEAVVYNWFSTAETLTALRGRSGLHRIRIHLPSLRLYKGDYYFRFYLSDPRGKTIYQTVEGVLPFQVQMQGVINEWGWQDNVCKYVEQCTVNIQSA